MTDAAALERPISFGPLADRLFAASDSFAKLAVALVKAQAGFPTIKKNKTADADKYSYSYADLAAVFEAVRAPLTKNGLTWVQPISTRGRDVEVVTILLHDSGEWIASRMVIAASDTTAQKIGSAITYAKRYSLCSLVGVASADEDDDGAEASQSTTNKPAKARQTALAAAPPSDVITPAQVTRLRTALRQHSVDEKRFGAYLKDTFGYTRWKDIEQARYAAIMELAESGAVSSAS